MVTDYGYQIMTEEQRETKPVKDPHFITLVVGNDHKKIIIYHLLVLLFLFSVGQAEWSGFGA